MTEEKFPPHNIEAEEAVLGSLLLDGEEIVNVIDLLKPQDFYREKNRWVYEACLSLYERKEEINQITVGQELARCGKLAAIGSSIYLSHLIGSSPTSIQIKSYAQIVHRLSVTRRLIDAGGQIARIGYDAEPDVDHALKKALEILQRVSEGERKVADKSRKGIPL